MDHRPADSATGTGPTRLEWDDLDDSVKRFFRGLPFSEGRCVIERVGRGYLLVLRVADELPTDVPVVVSNVTW